MTGELVIYGTAVSTMMAAVAWAFWITRASKARR